MNSRKAAAVFLMVFGGALALEAQVASNTQEMAEASQASNSNLGFEPVGPGDLIYITVTGAPELSRSSRVTTEGWLVLPLMKRVIPVAGLTPARISQAVAAELVREKLLVEPIVSAAVLEYRSRRVSVVGSVRMPATFQAVGDMRLVDAIARAQGLTPDAGPEVIVSFPSDKNGEKEPLHISLRALMTAKDSSLNIVLKGGEEIRVPEAQKLFIVGNVKMPGSFPLSDLDGSTVMKALALTQGALPFSAKRAYVYRLIGTTGKREEIPIELREILHRKAPDVALQANDILYIPDNPRMRLTANALDRMTGFGSSIATGLIVWQ